MGIECLVSMMLFAITSLIIGVVYVSYMYTKDINEAEQQIKAAERRAEVAERALQKFAEYITCEDCPFFSDCASSEKMGYRIHSNNCFSEYLKQAEKELQEERKDD